MWETTTIFVSGDHCHTRRSTTRWTWASSTSYDTPRNAARNTSTATRYPVLPGLSFNLIFSRLRGELQKSKDTDAELHNLMTARFRPNICTFKPQNMPPSPPPVRPPQAQQLQCGEQQLSSLAGIIATHDGPPPDGPGHPSPLTIPPETLLEIQVRLQDTQSSLDFPSTSSSRRAAKEQRYR
ncbi:hypothetical protein JOM56_009440 [Amanita muscaria]